MLRCTITASSRQAHRSASRCPHHTLANTPNPVVNSVTIDSAEDPLCPDGACPPPPDCQTPAAQGVALLAAPVGGGDPSDNQDCVRTAVTTVGGEDITPPTGPGGTSVSGTGETAGSGSAACRSPVRERCRSQRGGDAPRRCSRSSSCLTTGAAPPADPPRAHPPRCSSMAATASAHVVVPTPPRRPARRAGARRPDRPERRPRVSR